MDKDDAEAEAEAEIRNKAAILFIGMAKGHAKLNASIAYNNENNAAILYISIAIAALVN